MKIVRLLLYNTRVYLTIVARRQEYHNDAQADHEPDLLSGSRVNKW